MEEIEKKMGLIIIINIVMFALMMSASLILLLNSVGRENVINKLQSLGVMENKQEIQLQSEKLRREFVEFPHLYIFNESEGNSINRLSSDERIIFFKLKKNFKMDTQKAVAIIDLMKDYGFRYDYFISLLEQSEKMNVLQNQTIISELGPKYKAVIDEKLKNQPQIYRNVYLRGIYFDYVHKESMDYDARMFTRFAMGELESFEYFRRNQTYNTILHQNALKRALDFDEIQSLYRQL